MNVNLLRILFVVFLFTFFNNIDEGFAQEPLVNFSPQEQAWLKKHPVITLGGGGIPPMDFIDEEGKSVGISPDYNELIASMLGIKINYAYGTWKELIKKAKEKKIDGFRHFFKTKKREEYVNFVGPFTSVRYIILVPKNIEGISTLENLSHKRVGTMEGIYSHKFLADRYPDIDLVPYQNYRDALFALVNHDIEALVGSLTVLGHYIDKHFITGLKVVGFLPEMERDLYIGIRKDWPELAEMMNKAFATISPEQHRRIKNKWITLDFEPTKKKIALSPAEKKWLEAHPKIRLGVDPGYPPFEYIGKDKSYQGLASDYVKIVGEHLGIKMEVLPDLSWSQVIEGVKNKTIDMLPVVAKDYQNRRSEFLNFTIPYIEFPAVILTREDYLFVSKIRDFNGKTIVMVKNYYYNQQIVKKIPSAKIVEVETPLEALKALSEGKADGYVGNLAVANVLMRKHSIVNLKVAAPADVDNLGWSMGVRKDWPELVPILNKALASISEDKKIQISEKWISLSGQKIIDYTLVWRISAVSVVIITIILLWNYQIRNQKKILAQKEERLRKLNSIIVSQNKRMEEELKFGRRIQMSMVPSIFPPYPERQEFSIFASLKPAFEVGGDFYDFFFIDEYRFCFCIGDVSGKGVPAALLMAVTKTIIKSRAMEDLSTASITAYLNEQLSINNEECMFVTIFMGILNVKTGQLIYTNSGHNPTYFLPSNGSMKRLENRHGSPAGFYEDENYKEDELLLSKNDRLFLYTDGITEAMNNREKFFGDKRLSAILKSQKDSPVEELVSETVAAVKRFEDGSKQFDDITALCIEYHG